MTLSPNKVAFILIGACALLLSASSSEATTQDGLTVTVYDNRGFNASPPIPPTTPVAGQTTLFGINQNFDQQPLFNLYEDFVVKYEGFITAPCTCDVQMMALADDGTILYLDNELITNDWVDKGGGGTISEPIAFQEGVSKQITLWFYENGGGAWVQLLWNYDQQWEIVPDSAFTQAASTTTAQPTTTSTMPTTTTQEPTTTTTVFVDVPTTVETSTTEVQTTTSSTTTSSTTTTVAPSTTSTMPSTSTSTTTTLLIPVSTSTTTITQPPPEVVELSTEQAVAMATDEEVLVEASKEEAQEIFASIDEGELTPELGAEIVAAVQNAPEEVREAFEDEIDIFSGNTDTYVPIGSTIPVSQRRSLIAVSAVMSVAPVASRRRW